MQKDSLLLFKLNSFREARSDGIVCAACLGTLQQAARQATSDKNCPLLYEANYPKKRVLSQTLA